MGNYKPKREITMLVTVSVPGDMSPGQARKEVRTLITHQHNHSANPGEVVAVRVVHPTKDTVHGNTHFNRLAKKAGL